MDLIKERLTCPGLPPLLMRAPGATSLPDTLGQLQSLPEHCVVVIETSGSTTGTGSLIALGATHLRASAEATHAALAPSDGSPTGTPRWVTGLPTHHIAGFQVLVRSVLAGTTPVVADFSGGFSPAALARACEEAAAGEESAAHRKPGAAHSGGPGSLPYRVYTSLVPTQLHTLVDPRHRAAAATIAAHTSRILVGGAALPARTAAAAQACGLAIVRTYGMSETAGGCVYDGRPLAGVRVAIENPDDAGCGRIILTGPMVTTGTLRTGDRGHLSADGTVRVLGRMDDVIISGGVNVNPGQVESALDEAGYSAIIVGVPDERWGQRVTAVVHANDPAVCDLAALLVRMRADLALLPAACRPRAVVAVDQYPERGPGKIDRRKLTDLAAAELAAGRGATHEPDRGQRA